MEYLPFLNRLPSPLLSPALLFLPRPRAELMDISCSFSDPPPPPPPRMMDPKTMLVLEENTRKHVANESFMMGTFILYWGVVLLGAGRIFMRPTLLLHLYSYQDQGGFFV